MQNFVYFIQAQGPKGPIKIGVSLNPKGRLSALQTAHHEELVLLGVVPCALHFEKELHFRLKESHLRGEWYKPTPEVLAEVQKAKPPDFVAQLSLPKVSSTPPPIATRPSPTITAFCKRHPTLRGELELIRIVLSRLSPEERTEVLAQVALRLP
jgi:hypothetical protein